MVGGESGVRHDELNRRRIVDVRMPGHDPVAVGVLERNQSARDHQRVEREAEEPPGRSGFEDDLVHRDLTIEESGQQCAVHRIRAAAPPSSHSSRTSESSMSSGRPEAMVMTNRSTGSSIPSSAVSRAS